MPYIDRNSRMKYDGRIAGTCPLTQGDLNYCISKLIHYYLMDNDVLCYSNINEVVGVLECAKLELYRQIAAPYEDDKKSMNGPVSSLDAKT